MFRALRAEPSASNGESNGARDTTGRFIKGTKRPARAGRRLGTPNKVTREVKRFLAAVLNELCKGCFQQRLARLVAVVGVVV